VTVFNVALDTLILEIMSRSETTSKVNSMFSFIWNSNTDSNNAKAQELAKHYPRDLVEEQFVEEICPLSNVHGTLFEKVTSLDLLNKIFKKSPDFLPPDMRRIKDFCFHTSVSISRRALLQQISPS